MQEVDLRRLQMVELEILKKIDSVREENNIRYYLVGVKRVA